jgi:hypothetical protein
MIRRRRRRRRKRRNYPKREILCVWAILIGTVLFFINKPFFLVSLELLVLVGLVGAGRRWWRNSFSNQIRQEREDDLN